MLVKLTSDDISTLIFLVAKNKKDAEKNQQLLSRLQEAYLICVNHPDMV